MRQRIIKWMCGIQVVALLCWMNTYIHANAKCRDENDGYICCGSYHTYGHYNYLTTLEGNKKGIRFIKVGSFSSENKKKINKAIDKWNEELKLNSTNKYFYLSHQTSNEQISVQSSILEKGVLGFTRFFQVGGGQITVNKKGMLTSKYAKAVVSLDEEKGYIQRVAAHELGHALGLSHRVCNTQSIMYNYMKEIKVTLPQRTDVKMAHHVYSIC